MHKYSNDRITRSQNSWSVEIKLFALETISLYPQAQSSAHQNRLHSTLSSQVLSISKKGDSTTFPGNLFHCLRNLTVKNHSTSRWKSFGFFFFFRYNFLWQFVPIAYWRDIGHRWEESGPTSFLAPMKYLYALPRPFESFVLQTEQSQCSQPLLVQ